MGRVFDSPVSTSMIALMVPGMSGLVSGEEEEPPLRRLAMKSVSSETAAGVVLSSPPR